MILTPRTESQSKPASPPERSHLVSSNCGQAWRIPWALVRCCLWFPRPAEAGQGGGRTEGRGSLPALCTEKLPFLASHHAGAGRLRQVERGPGPFAEEETSLALALSQLWTSKLLEPEPPRSRDPSWHMVESRRSRAPCPHLYFIPAFPKIEV